jgi:hypothetical protein
MKTLPLMQVTVERLSIVSDKPFASVLAKIRGGIGRNDMNKFWEEVWSADSARRANPGPGLHAKRRVTRLSPALPRSLGTKHATVQLP